MPNCCVVGCKNSTRSKISKKPKVLSRKSVKSDVTEGSNHTGTKDSSQAGTSNEVVKSEFASKGKVSFHKFPRNQKLKDTWIEKIPRTKFELTSWTTICSDHFEPACFSDITVKKTANKHKCLNDHSVPTIFPAVPLKSSKAKSKVSAKKTEAALDKLSVREQCDHSYAFPSQKELKQKMDLLIEENQILKKRLKIAVQSKKHFSDKCQSLKRIVKDLEERDCIGICGRKEDRMRREKNKNIPKQANEKK